MSVKVFYFSGTGNTLTVAKNIAASLKAELVSIPKVMLLDEIVVDADCMGIVFPSYLALLSGLPLLVERFIRKISNIASLKIFAVCTCGGYEFANALPSLYRLKQIIRECGGTLKGEYSVRLPMNNLDYDHIPIPITRNHEIIIRKSKSKINDICSRILRGNSTKCKIAKSILVFIMTPISILSRPVIVKALTQKAKEAPDSNKKFTELIPLTDKSIIVDEKCIGCGICEKVCPVENIRIVDKRPVFLHRCEMCFACDEWCPSGAIHHWSRAEGVKYHYPEVKVTDMFR